MPNTTRQKLIDCGLKRFYSEGFRNAGLDQILSDVGITKTAFYKHFTCKEELMLAVLKQRAEWLRSRFAEALRDAGGRSATGQLLAIIDVIEQLIEDDTPEDFRGCIVINASIEFPLLHEPVHQAAMQYGATLAQILHDIAERAGAENPQALADELALIISGTYVTRQLSGSPQAFDTARRSLRLTLAAHGVKAGKSALVK